MRQYKITFLSPGTLFSESSTKDIDAWDTKKAVQMAESITERYNAKPYGFRFETWKAHAPIEDEEGDILEVKPKLEKSSGIYFLGGKLETYDEIVARDLDKEEILRSNMRGNNYWIVCVNDNSWRSTLPFNKEDRIVDVIGAVIESGDDPKWVQYRKEQAKLNTKCGY